MLTVTDESIFGVSAQIFARNYGLGSFGRPERYCSPSEKDYRGVL